ncbi:uncharacterized protein MONOS_6262 [Monocercomonoides exilis]|uniref:uncharacterized protein n=1 Tax=Monocercomonoides exilis TaxID=2049356 RepID=UPI00355A73B8|nr:hypothetical protein MONOS_6262 [Monocercomonoides exilis]|eukprot:MONOS_6262.1-p1 / transcript=MONOS_6262.1 / gene=MONOS_6262 / organism=Monocercomonoides_exilis_PA203 / gene_product=unspecified product / transcript_product=unspecified product / location=Mono_scaffold00195:3245-5222(-) / protein_length=534 / sequence_SO=supercontig / SO=protein_coding / is_pseudo=false
MASDTSATQAFLSYNCPVVYGPEGYPLFILASFFVSCLLYTVVELFQEFTLKRKKIHKMKLLFLIFMGIFFFFKSFVLVAPLPYSMFAYSLVCYQLPRCWIMIAWQFMVLWLGPSSVFSTNPSSKMKYYIPISFAAIDLILIVLLIVMSAFAKFETGNVAKRVTTTSITNLFAFAMIDLMVGVYCLILLLSIRKRRLSQSFKWRTRILLIVSFVIFCFYFLRCIWNITDLANVNVIKERWKTTYDKCLSDDGFCWQYYLHYFIFYTFFDVIPPALMLGAFALLMRRRSRPSKQTPKGSDKSSSSNNFSAANNNNSISNVNSKDSSASSLKMRPDGNFSLDSSINYDPHTRSLSQWAVPRQSSRLDPTQTRDYIAMCLAAEEEGRKGELWGRSAVDMVVGNPLTSLLASDGLYGADMVQAVTGRERVVGMVEMGGLRAEEDEMSLGGGGGEGEGGGRGGRGGGNGGYMTAGQSSDNSPFMSSLTSLDGAEQYSAPSFSKEGEENYAGGVASGNEQEKVHTVKKKKKKKKKKKDN